MIKGNEVKYEPGNFSLDSLHKVLGGSLNRDFIDRRVKIMTGEEGMKMFNEALMGQVNRKSRRKGATTPSKTHKKDRRIFQLD